MKKRSGTRFENNVTTQRHNMNQTDDRKPGVTLPGEFLERIDQAGIDYNEYMNRFRNQAQSRDQEAPDEDERRLRVYTALNFRRGERIEKTYSVSPELKALMESISEPQIWMTLTEPWCRDSGQTLPYIAKIAACSSLVALKILYRDENLDIMDRYLTNGARSTPKLVAFDSSGKELFQWGPRPKPARELIRELKSLGVEKEQMYEKLHLWYGRDKGTTLEKEFIELLRFE